MWHCSRVWGRAFDITLKTAEDAAKLANIGFDYDQELKPLTLLGAKTVHVSIFVSVEYPDEDLVDIVKTYDELKNENLRRLYFKEPGFTHVENGVRVAQYSKITKDMLRKIFVGGMEIGFKYSGQPTTCYRCHSTEHVVKDCPQGCNRAPNVWRRGGIAPVLPPPPVPPVEKNPKPAETADSADRAETLPSGNGLPQLFSLTATSTAADVTLSEEMEGTPAAAKRKVPPLTATRRMTWPKKGISRIQSRPTLNQRPPPLSRRQRIRATNSSSLRWKSRMGEKQIDASHPWGLLLPMPRPVFTALPWGLVKGQGPLSVSRR